MDSWYSHMERLNYVLCMIYDLKNSSFKASLIGTGKFFDASDDEIDEIP